MKKLSYLFAVAASAACLCACTDVTDVRPAEYVKDMFESIGVVEADKKATMFYSIMFFYYSLYDGAKDKKRIKEQFEKSISNII